MVAQTDVAKIVPLIDELKAINQAIANLEGGGPILHMLVGAPHESAARSAPMNTGFMHFPPQMIDGIRDQAKTRQNEIRQRLGELGLNLTE